MRYENCKSPEVTVRPSDGIIIKTNFDAHGNVIGTDEMSHAAAKHLVGKLQAAMRSVEVLFKIDRLPLPRTGETRRGNNEAMNDAFVKAYDPNVSPPFYVEWPKGNEFGSGGWYSEESILELWPEVVPDESSSSDGSKERRSDALVVETGMSAGLVRCIHRRIEEIACDGTVPIAKVSELFDEYIEAAKHERSRTNGLRRDALVEVNRLLDEANVPNHPMTVDRVRTLIEVRDSRGTSKG